MKCGRSTASGVAEKSWFFRNALVRANYANRKLDIDKTQLHLEEFFKVLIYGHDIELKNRYLRIGSEYGSRNAEAMKVLHRCNDGTNVVIIPSDVGINDVDVGINVDIKLTSTEEEARKAIQGDPKLTAAKLAAELGVTVRQSERILASLKKKAGLKRRGARKNGEWYFAPCVGVGDGGMGSCRPTGGDESGGMGSCRGVQGV